MNDLESIKYNLLQAYVNTTSTPAFVEEINKVIGIPFYIFDPSFRMMAGIVEDIKEKFLKNYNDNYILSLHEVTKAVGNKDLEDLYRNDEINTLNIESLDGSILFKRISDGKYCLGYVCLYVENKEISDKEKEILNTLCLISAHYLKTKGYSKTIKQVALCKIIDNDYKNEFVLDKVIDNLNLQQSNIRVMVIRANRPKQLESYIISKGNDIYSFEYNDDVVSIVSKDISMDFIEEIVKEFSDDFVRIGISEVFNDIKQLSNYYSQAVKSIEIGRKYKNNKQVNYFEDYAFISSILDTDKQKVEKLIDKRVITMMKYDEEESTSYTNDLKVYFDCGRNINNASQVLNVHKNSMYYRLNKIKELFNIDVENTTDCFNTELSLNIINIINN